MSKLLTRAKVKFAMAEDCYRRIADDDAFIDECCYDLQQSIEFTIKYMVEMNGDTYTENHDIRSNLNKLTKLNVKVPCYNELRSIAAELLSWETESRYNDSFVAVFEDIEVARKCAQSLIEYCESLTQQSKIEEEKLKTAFPEGRLQVQNEIK